MKYHDGMMQICKDTKSLYYITETCDMLLTYAGKMPEELDIRKTILESIIDDEIKDYTGDKDLVYTVLHTCLLKVFQTTKNKDKEGTQEMYNQIIRVMKHHRMNDYAIMNFEIIISLLLFSLDPDMVDQGRLFEMKNKFVKVSEIAENKDQQ
jgi:hypothetical protein